MLISQKQTLVSSDTSCAVWNRRDFFVCSHSLSSPFVYFLSPAALSLQTLTELCDQRKGVNVTRAVKTSLGWTIQSDAAVYKRGPFKTFILSLCRHTSSHICNAHTVLLAAVQHTPCDQNYIKTPSPMLPCSLLSTSGTVHRDSLAVSDSAVNHQLWETFSKCCLVSCCDGLSYHQSETNLSLSPCLSCSCF